MEIQLDLLLDRAHTGHSPTLVLLPRVLLNIPTRGLVDLVGLDVIVNILLIAA
jgi:hypothetical protein